MAGPWEKYQRPPEATPPAAGRPWERFGAPAAAPADDPFELVQELQGGRVVRNRETGSLSFTSPGFATSDQDMIARAMDGESIEEMGRQKGAETTLGMNPLQRAGGAAAQFLRGLPFVGSFADEAGGAVFGDDFRENMNEGAELFEEANPNTSIALNVGGALSTAPVAIAGAGAMRGLSLGQKILAGTAGGGVLGAIEGGTFAAGDAEPGGRLDAIPGGAMMGGGVGAGLGFAMPLGGQLARAVTRANAGREARRAAAAAGMSQRTAGLVADRVLADAPDAAATIARAGDSATLGTLGPSTRALTDAVANSGSEAAAVSRRNVGEIVESASTRLRQTFDEVLGPPAGFMQAADDVMDSSRAARKQAYDAAYSAPINYASEAGRELQGLVSTAERVAPGAKLEAANLFEIAIQKGEISAPPHIMAKISDAGEITFEELPGVAQLDFLTRALNGRASFGTGTSSAVSEGYKDISRLIRRKLDELVPEYRTARAIGADAISEREAIDLGRSIMKPGTTREEVARAVAGMSPAELQRARQGARAQIDEVLANARRGIGRGGQDAVETVTLLRQTNSAALREKLAAIMPAADAERLIAALDEADHAFSSQLAVKSPTAPRLLDDEAVRATVGEPITDQVRKEGVLGTIRNRAADLAGSGGVTSEEALATNRAEIADVMTRRLTGPETIEAMRGVSEAGERLIQSGEAARGVAEGAIAGGAPVGLAFSRPAPVETPAQIRRLSEMGFSQGEIADLLNDPARLRSVLEGAP